LNDSKYLCWRRAMVCAQAAVRKLRTATHLARSRSMRSTAVCHFLGFCKRRTSVDNFVKLTTSKLDWLYDYAFCDSNILQLCRMEDDSKTLHLWEDNMSALVFYMLFLRTYIIYWNLSHATMLRERPIHAKKPT
jgi:hypothetical protein